MSTISYLAQNLPRNVADWVEAQSTGEQYNSVRKVVRWLKSIDRRVWSGTTIGKSPQTLILDISHHGAEFYIDANGAIKFHGETVTTKKEFTKVLTDLTPPSTSNPQTEQK
ncbi:MAG: hypothetical protein JHC54_05740 [Acinetobacter sp.]|nr:hypothetical protein [Acinetobacter sp.]